MDAFGSTSSRSTSSVTARINHRYSDATFMSHVNVGVLFEEGADREGALNSFVNVGVLFAEDDDRQGSFNSFVNVGVDPSRSKVVVVHSDGWGERLTVGANEFLLIDSAEYVAMNYVNVTDPAP